MSTSDPIVIKKVVEARNVPKTNEKVIVDFAAPVSNDPKFRHGFFSYFSKVEFQLKALGCVMKNIELRPTSLSEQLRANNFPEVISDVLNKLKSKLTDETMEQLNELEISRQKRLGMNPIASEKSVIVKVDKIDATDSIIPWGILQTGANLIAAEKWTIAYVPASTNADDSTLIANAPTAEYRVNYYTAMDGDFFYPDVVPHNVPLGQSYDWAKGKITGQFTKKPTEDVHEVHLSKPPRM